MTSPIYRKTAYELVREAAYSLGKDGKAFSYQEVLNYIRRTVIAKLKWMSFYFF